MLAHVYEDQALSINCVYEWFTRFREGWECVSDNPRSERPVTSVSDENIEKETSVQSTTQYAQQGSSFFVHDNARPRTANIVQQFLSKNGWCKLNLRHSSSRLLPIPTTQTRFERKEI
ncbi:hypothetical protein TNCV_1126371 [Trichonephila clavipes]|nr:hypothetical protein TNCV_1126371 [Trichonephila clavipes]